MAVSRIKCIIFDLDDTLYEQKQFLKGAFKDCADYAVKWGVSKQKFYRCLMTILKKKGSGCGDIFDRALKEFNLYSKERVAELVEIFYAHQPDINIYADAKKILPYLHRRYKLCLITDGKPDLQMKKIKSLGIEKYFDAIVFSDLYGREHRKPSILPYKKALAKVHVKSENAIFVGDNPYKDFIGAKKIGLKTVRLNRGEFRDVKLDSDFEAAYKINNFNELLKILGRWECNRKV